MTEADSHSPSFQWATQRTESVRVTILLGLLGSLLVLALIRGVASLAGGYPDGEAWPFALFLTAMMVYEALWIRLVRPVIKVDKGVSAPAWQANILVESLLPAAALILQVHSLDAGPQRVFTSPVVLAWFLFIILSALHLNPRLTRLSGAYFAAAYAVVCIYAYLHFPEAAAGGKLMAWGTAFYYVAFLLLGGFAGAAVAHQIRLRVIEALHEAESRAEIAQRRHAREIARSIQQELLPVKTPPIEGFDIAGWNQPAGEIGADYFDWQELQDGRIVFTIADIAGHGIGSALCMAACRAYARAGFATETDLRSVLLRLNHLLYQDLPAERYVTLAAGVLDPDEATLELLSAGQGPLLFYLSAEDRFRSYDAQGLPLGLMPQPNYGSPQVLKFAPGDILVLLTDGLVDWANTKDEDFGQNRVKEVIRMYREYPAATIISRLYTAVLNFSGATPQPDDVTVLILKRDRMAYQRVTGSEEK